MTIDTVRLGSTGLVVSRQGLGCMGMGGAYGPADDTESVATIRHAVELGITLFDTADMYGNRGRGPGSVERLVGRALRPYRDRIVLATKFGFVLGDPARSLCGRPDYVRRACDESLRRLGVDHIDLYYSHRLDPEVPVTDTIGAMADLVSAGKVRHLGLSVVSGEVLRAAHAVHPISAVQSEYSLWCRDVEDDPLPTARELGVGFVPYSPLGRGYLTGAVRDSTDLAGSDLRTGLTRFQPDTLAANRAIVEEVGEIAARRAVTPAQVALAWVHAQGTDLVPIPGTKRRAYLEDNVGALGIELTAAELARLEPLAHRVHG